MVNQLFSNCATGETVASRTDWKQIVEGFLSGCGIPFWGSYQWTLDIIYLCSQSDMQDVTARFPTKDEKTRRCPRITACRVQVAQVSSEQGARVQGNWLMERWLFRMGVVANCPMGPNGANGISAISRWGWFYCNSAGGQGCNDSVKLLQLGRCDRVAGNDVLLDQFLYRCFFGAALVSDTWYFGQIFLTSPRFMAGRLMEKGI